MRHPNMDETGRLPHYGLYHMGMEVRFTQTVAAPNANRGYYSGYYSRICIRRHAHQKKTEPTRVIPLWFFAVCLMQSMWNCKMSHAGFYRIEACRQHSTHVVEDCRECLVKPLTNEQAWSLKVTLPSALTSGIEEVSVKMRRTQIPLCMTVKASLLHVLQGTYSITTDPGLIFHWRFPRRLQADMRWLAAYVALSISIVYVRSLKRLRSVGLGTKIRTLLEHTHRPDRPIHYQHALSNFLQRKKKPRRPGVVNFFSFKCVYPALSVPAIGVSCQDNVFFPNAWRRVLV